MTSNAGATIEDDIGDMDMNSEFRIVIRTLLTSFQFFGFSGSSWSLHVTYSAQVSRMKVFACNENAFPILTRYGSLASLLAGFSISHIGVFVKAQIL